MSCSVGSFAASSADNSLALSAMHNSTSLSGDDGARSFLADMPEQSLLSSTQYPRHYDTIRHSIGADELYSYFLDSDYETEYESESEFSQKEEDSISLEALQDSIDDIVNRTPRYIEATPVNISMNKSLTCPKNEISLYQPNMDDIRDYETMRGMGVMSTPKKMQDSQRQSSFMQNCDAMDTIADELDSMEVVNELEKAAIYQYLENKQRKKYLFDGANMIRIKPKRNAALAAVMGRAYLLRRKIKEKLIKREE